MVKNIDKKYLLFAIVNLIFSIIALNSYSDIFFASNNSFGVIGFGLSIIFVEWCCYACDKSLQNTKGETDGNDDIRKLEAALPVISRVMIFCIPVAWFFKHNTLAIIFGCIACLILAMDKLLDYKTQKSKLLIFFSCAYVFIAIVGIWKEFFY